jgi:hypothetical protein
VVETEAEADGVASLLRSQLQPSALDVLHPGRVALLFEGSECAVAAQLERARALVGGAEADGSVWEESRARQEVSKGRVHFAPGELRSVLEFLQDAVLRPSAGIAYAAQEIARDDPLQEISSGRVKALEALVERIARELDPRGVLAP